MTAKPRLRRCAFWPSGITDAQDTPICHCGSLKTDAVHRTVELTDEQRAADARRIGDH